MFYLSSFDVLRYRKGLLVFVRPLSVIRLLFVIFNSFIGRAHATESAARIAVAPLACIDDDELWSTALRTSITATSPDTPNSPDRFSYLLPPSRLVYRQYFYTSCWALLGVFHMSVSGRYGCSVHVSQLLSCFGFCASVVAQAEGVVCETTVSGYSRTTECSTPAGRFY